mmetsp:Transcript_56111/g.87360  ORF Transcript_56111/g.87360 Transcript_56111/m.87360 type:complete len:225 (-) Transcript_56111:460-1134(-)
MHVVAGGASSRGHSVLPCKRGGYRIVSRIRTTHARSVQDECAGHGVSWLWTSQTHAELREEYFRGCVDRFSIRSRRVEGSLRTDLPLRPLHRFWPCNVLGQHFSSGWPYSGGTIDLCERGYQVYSWQPRRKGLRRAFPKHLADWQRVVSNVVHSWREGCIHSPRSLCRSVQAVPGAEIADYSSKFGAQHEPLVRRVVLGGARDQFLWSARLPAGHASHDAQPRF